jgi:hypothetical protein
MMIIRMNSVLTVDTGRRTRDMSAGGTTRSEEKRRGTQGVIGGEEMLETVPSFRVRMLSLANLQTRTGTLGQGRRVDNERLRLRLLDGVVTEGMSETEMMLGCEGRRLACMIGTTVEEVPGRSRLRTLIAYHLEPLLLPIARYCCNIFISCPCRLKR